MKTPRQQESSMEFEIATQQLDRQIAPLYGKLEERYLRRMLMSPEEIREAMKEEES